MLRHATLTLHMIQAGCYGDACPLTAQGLVRVTFTYIRFSCHLIKDYWMFIAVTVLKGCTARGDEEELGGAEQ